MELPYTLLSGTSSDEDSQSADVPCFFNLQHNSDPHEYSDCGEDTVEGPVAALLGTEVAETSTQQGDGSCPACSACASPPQQPSVAAAAVQQQQPHHLVPPPAAGPLLVLEPLRLGDWEIEGLLERLQTAPLPDNRFGGGDDGEVAAGAGFTQQAAAGRNSSPPPVDESAAAPAPRNRASETNASENEAAATTVVVTTATASAVPLSCELYSSVAVTTEDSPAAAAAEASSPQGADQPCWSTGVKIWSPAQSHQPHVTDLRQQQPVLNTGTLLAPVGSNVSIGSSGCSGGGEVPDASPSGSEDACSPRAGPSGLEGPPRRARARDWRARLGGGAAHAGRLPEWGSARSGSARSGSGSGSRGTSAGGPAVATDASLSGSRAGGSASRGSAGKTGLLDAAPSGNGSGGSDSDGSQEDWEVFRRLGPKGRPLQSQAEA